MIACLPMYDWPEQQQANNAYWAKIAKALTAAGISAPTTLTRDKSEAELWRDHDLLLGQTCGYPLATELGDVVRYVATPVYDVTGCKGATYSSAIVTHGDAPVGMNDFATARFAFNAASSLSGYRCMVEISGDPQEAFGALLQSGGHRGSARMVAARQADIAAIDAVCLDLLKRFEVETYSALKVIGWTNFYPALPMITTKTTSDETLKTLQKILLNLSPEKDLAIKGYEIVDRTRYAGLARL